MKRPLINDDVLGALAATAFVVSVAALIGILLFRDDIISWWLG